MTKVTLAALLAALKLLQGNVDSAEQQLASAKQEIARIDAIIQSQPCTDCAARVGTITELRTALDAGEPEIVLTANVDGDITISKPVTLTSSVPVPTTDMRIEATARLPSIRGRVTIAANGVTIKGVKFLPGIYDVIIQMNRGTRDQLLDSIIIDGEDNGKVKRGVQMNAANAEVRNSQIIGIWKSGQDSQAIAAWDTPGPLRIINNALESASENFMVGGADPVDPTTIPTDITVEGNYFYKRPEWRAYAKGAIGPDGLKRAMAVKNLIEFKFGRKIRARKNIFRGSWTDGQTGFAWLFTTSNQNGTFVNSIVEDVIFEQNEVYDCENGIQVAGYHGVNPSKQGNTYLIRDNLFVISSGRFIQMLNEPRDIVFDHNTIIHYAPSVAVISRGAIRLPDMTQVPGGPILGFRFTNNLTVNGVPSGGAGRNVYGLSADGMHNGKWLTDTTDPLLPGAVVAGNVLAGAAQASGGHSYPATNAFPTIDEFKAGLDPVTYRLVRPDVFAVTTTDGTPVGRR
jgi:hypothetical protein